jgi:hypothetical protein
LQVFTKDADSTFIIAPDVAFQVIRFLLLGAFGRAGLLGHGLTVPPMEQQVGTASDHYLHAVGYSHANTSLVGDDHD